MKVLLVYPYFIDQRINEEDVSAIPMGLYYVGAMLRANGYAVDILNAYNLKGTPHRIYRVLGDKRPDIVGFSILHANRWGGIDIARMVKKVNPGATVIFGGVGATFLWDHFLTHFPEIDYVVRGEAEHSFLELVRWLEKAPSQPPPHIHGLAFRQADKPVKTDDREPIADLDSLPMPADYFTFQHVSLTRGCPSACTFCGSPAFWKRRVRFHSPDYFVTQLERLREKGVTFFFVSDDTFTLKRNLVIDVCRRIIDRGLDIVWVAISRVDRVDEAMLGWMRRAGCAQISYGVESGSQVIRDRFQKRISDKDIHRAFDLTTRAGIMARAYFIYGAPGESDQTIADSLAMLRRIRPLAAIFYILDLFPGTQLYEDYKRRTGVTDDIWLDRIEDILYFETDETLSQQAILDFGRQLREVYFALLPEFTQQIDLMDDPAFDALHADFLSRLGMTFSHGEYAMNPLVKDNLTIAVGLFERSLTYHPDHRAFWGLGLVYQHQHRFEESIDILNQGISHYQDSVDLHIALANSLIHRHRYKEAYQCLERFAHHPQVIDQLIRCCRFIGDRKKEHYWIGQLNHGQSNQQASPVA
ncbi:cobalamin-binding radical SAM domain protein [Desulfosarcina variabilis str. Montpellier]|uniref:radical SAM protein n=1 Tax=Desulfosarcina variabilis TaxID=2300 RepID=UPI003AFB494A